MFRQFYQVALLDATNRSYIARELLANTHADGALGSDVFFPPSEAAACAARVEQWIRDCLTNTAADQSANDLPASTLMPKGAADKGIGDHRSIPGMHDPLLEGLRIRVEEAACLTQNCAGQPQTTAFLAWEYSAQSVSVFTDSGGSSACSLPVDHPAFKLNRACADVTAADVAASLPASWTLEAWAAGNHEAPHYPRPRFAVGQAVECRFFLRKDDLKEPEKQEMGQWSPWEVATVVAVGYREESWARNVRATYVVKHQDGRLLTIARDEKEVIREHTNVPNGRPP